VVFEEYVNLPPGVWVPKGAWLRDTVLNTTTRVPGGDDSVRATISGDGRYVAFVKMPLEYRSTNVYIWDRIENQTHAVGVRSDGLVANGTSGYGPAGPDSPLVSRDGRFVVLPQPIHRYRGDALTNRVRCVRPAIWSSGQHAG